MGGFLISFLGNNSINCIKIELTEGFNLQNKLNPADLINPPLLTLLICDLNFEYNM